jgi:hypothetical protein
VGIILKTLLCCCSFVEFSDYCSFILNLISLRFEDVIFVSIYLALVWVKSDKKSFCTGPYRVQCLLSHPTLVDTPEKSWIGWLSVICLCGYFLDKAIKLDLIIADISGPNLVVDLVYMLWLIYNQGVYCVTQNLAFIFVLFFFAFL